MKIALSSRYPLPKQLKISNYADIDHIVMPAIAEIQ